MANIFVQGEMVRTQGEQGERGPSGLPEDAWLEVLSWEPRIFLYHNFLSEEECDELIEKVRLRVTSMVVFGLSAWPVSEANCSRQRKAVFLYGAGKADDGAVRGRRQRQRGLKSR